MSSHAVHLWTLTFSLFTRWASRGMGGWQSRKRRSFGLLPFPVIVTTRIMTFVGLGFGDPYKPSFATLTGKGTNPSYHTCVWPSCMVSIFGRLSTSYIHKPLGPPCQQRRTSYKSWLWHQETCRPHRIPKSTRLVRDCANEDERLCTAGIVSMYRMVSA